MEYSVRVFILFPCSVKVYH